MKQYTAKNLNDVLALAAQDKNCSLEDLNYEIIEEKKGILGIGNSVTIKAYTLNDVKEFLFDYLGNFFTEIDYEIEVEITEIENGFKVKLNSDNNAKLIGHNGRTLHAINTVVKSAVNNHFKKKYTLLIDINNYKDERYKKVKSMAIRIAKNVKRTKIDAVLDPMPNDERKIIHQALTNFENIKTESEGEGKNRHLKIMYVESK